jgi:hypothetical protein
MPFSGILRGVVLVQPPAHSGSSLADFFYPEDGGDMFLRNVSSHKNHAVPHSKKRHSSRENMLKKIMKYLSHDDKFLYKGQAGRDLFLQINTRNWQFLCVTTTYMVEHAQYYSLKR